MSTKSCFLVFLITLGSIGVCAGQVKKSTADDLIDQLVGVTQRILAGGNLDRNDTLVASGARVVSGSLNTNLREVVAGKNTSFSLAEDTSRQGIDIRLKSNDNDDAAFLLLTTATRQKRDLRYHTVVFMRDHAGQWRIESWHTSQ
jgi:hypothetical protein